MDDKDPSGNTISLGSFSSLTDEQMQHQRGMFVDLGELEKIDMILQSPRAGGNDVPAPFVNHRVLGLVTVTAIMILYTSGSPYGTEYVVYAAGPLLAILGFVVFSLFVAAPYGVVVAELCSAFPEDGGFVVWVLNAFGPFWAFQVGWWSWIGSVLASTVHPRMIFFLIFTEFAGLNIESSAAQFGIKVAIAIIVTLPMLLGTRSVGKFSAAAVFLMALAYIIFTIWSLTMATEWDDLLEVRHDQNKYDPLTRDAEFIGDVNIEWNLFFNVLYWNYGGINMISVFGGEVKNPAGVLRSAIAITVLVSLLLFTIPMIAGLVTDKLHWTFIGRNSFAYMAKAIGGTPLHTIVFIGSVAATMGSFTASTFCQSFQLSGMAQNRLVWSKLAKNDRVHSSPLLATLASLLVTIPVLVIDPMELIPITNMLTAGVEVFVLFTAIMLRRKLPYIPRPSKVPGGIPVLVVATILPALIFVYVTVEVFRNTVSAIIGALLILLGAAYGAYRFYYVKERNVW